MPAVSVIRERLRRAAQAAGVEPQAAAVYRLFDRTAARDHRDNEHLTALLAAVLAPDANCVDIGAHTGGVLRDMVRCAPAGRHVAFEPLPELAAALAREFPGVDVRNAAARGRRGRAGVQLPRLGPDAQQPRRGGRDAPPAGDARTLRVRTERLDDVLPADYVPTLVKVDVEGAEEAAFRGALETLRRHKPIVVFEHGLGGADRYGSGPSRDLGADRRGRRAARSTTSTARVPYSRQAFIDVFDRPIWNFLARP